MISDHHNFRRGFRVLESGRLCRSITGSEKFLLKGHTKHRLACKRGAAITENYRTAVSTGAFPHQSRKSRDVFPVAFNGYRYRDRYAGHTPLAVKGVPFAVHQSNGANSSHDMELVAMSSHPPPPVE